MGNVYDLQTPRKAKAADLFRIKSLREITMMPKEEFLIRGLVPRQGFGVLFGASGSLKSFAALDLSFAVATGRSWASRGVRQGAAVYVAAEGASGVAKRVLGIIEQDQSIPDTVPFHLLPASPDLGNAKSDVEKLINSIEAAEIKPAIVVLDTLAQMLHGADENGAGMAAFVKNAQAISSHFGCFVLAIHHIGHVAGNRLRGHSSLPAAADLIIRADRLPDAVPASTLYVEKAKDGPTDTKLTVTLRRVSLGFDEEGAETSTLVVDRIEDGLDPREERTNKAKSGNAQGKPPKVPDGAKNALSALTSALRDYGVEHEGNPNIPAGAKVVSVQHWRERAYSEGNGEPDSKRRAFGRNLEKLQALGKVRVWEDLAWVA